MSLIDTYQIATMGYNSSNTYTVASLGILYSVQITPLPPEPLEVPVQQQGVNSTVAGLSMLSSGISGGLSGYNFGTGLDDYFNE